MLHHEESPEKPQCNMATPLFLGKPPPPPRNDLDVKIALSGKFHCYSMWK